jgi:hypothetical protein
LKISKVLKLIFNSLNCLSFVSFKRATPKSMGCVFMGGTSSQTWEECSEAAASLPLVFVGSKKKKKILPGREMGFSMCELCNEVAVGCADASVSMVGSVKEVHFQIVCWSLTPSSRGAGWSPQALRTSYLGACSGRGRAREQLAELFWGR